MIKSTLDIEQELYRHLNRPSIRSIISGNIMNGDRPIYAPNATKKEDIVINTITLDNSMNQMGAANINIWVPDIINPYGGTGKTPNKARLNIITKAILPLVDEYYPMSQEETFHFWVEWTQLFREESLDYSYMNIRLQYRNINYY
jgi:hypothetical protein